jgi:hypothetical protein
MAGLVGVWQSARMAELRHNPNWSPQSQKNQPNNDFSIVFVMGRSMHGP